MRKRILLLLMLTVTLTLVAGTAQATPTTELTALAEYYPADTPLFLTLRTDDAFLTELDTALANLIHNLGDLFPVERFSIKDFINRPLAGALLDFDDDIRPWLGDSAAFGILSLDRLLIDPDAPDLPFVLAVAIADRDAAETFIGDLLRVGEAMPETTITDVYTLYEFRDDQVVLLGQDVLLIGNHAGAIVDAFEGAAGTLAANPTFAEVAGLLPAGDYDAFFYENVGVILDTLVTVVERQRQAEGEHLPALFENFRETMRGAAVAAGLSLVDGRNLLVDFVSSAEYPLPMPEAQPVNLDFAAYVPADAQMIVLDNGFGPDTLAVFDALDQIGPILQAEYELLLSIWQETGFEREPETEFARQLVEGLDFSVIKFGGIAKNTLIPIFAGFTGLHLEEDVLSWMTGDYAMYLRAMAIESPLEFTVDFNFTTAATDAGRAQAVVDRLTEVAGMYDLEYTTETIGGGEALALPALLPSFFPPKFSDRARQTPELALMVGANDTVFSAGTRPGVEFALNPAGDSLLENPAFQHADDTLFLPDATTIVYIGTGGLVETILNVSHLIQREEDAQGLAFLLSQVESLTFSTSAPREGVTLGRLTLTIPEEVTVAPPPTFGSR